MADERTEELQAGLHETRERIARACAAAGRDPSEVTLIVVTKTWPAADVERLASLGVTDVGENRDQEAAPKAADTGDLDLTWHFIGQLQTNKAASVARYAGLVHSVDRPALVGALDKAADKAGRTLDCLVQVSLDPQDTEGRGGIPLDKVTEIADAIAAAPHLHLRGVMGVAPLGGDPATAFARLALARETIRRTHPDAGIMSAGMSEDLEEAVAAGATHLRVGSAILGTRVPRG